jgi:hypothetical protein
VSNEKPSTRPVAPVFRVPGQFLPDRCYACGRQFGRNPWLTWADWFKGQHDPPEFAIVHYGCRHRPLTKYRLLHGMARELGETVAWVHNKWAETGVESSRDCATIRDAQDRVERLADIIGDRTTRCGGTNSGW